MNRRDFLKAISFNLGGFFLPNWLDLTPLAGELALLRVGADRVNVYGRPDRASEIIEKKEKDDLLCGYYQVLSGNGRNRLWYRVWKGYVHSAGLQLVGNCQNRELVKLPAEGLLAEVSVPYSQSVRYSGRAGWELNYRLYYGSVHWIEAVEEGPDGGAWYRIKDSYDREYYARAADLRPITEDELTPIATDVPGSQKHIEVSIAEQTLRAFEGEKMVLQTTVSTGLPQLAPLEAGEIPSDTPLGHHHITVKTPTRHMGDQAFSAEKDTQALPGVPWVSFFHESGVSLHGTYWHSNFGVRMSHGCVNMRSEEARWIYRWANPVIGFAERQTSDWGTRVYVYDSDQVG